MNKQQFLDKLKARLEILSESEVIDILDEYSDTIDQKIQEGMSEEDAVKDFGDLNDLADDILEAYKINTKNKKSKSQDRAQQFGDILQQVVNYLEKFFTTLFKDLSVEKATRSLVLIGVAIVLIFFLRIPFAFLRWGITGVLKMLLPFGLGTILSVVAQIIISLAFLVLAILIIISFVRVEINNEELTVDNLFKKPLKEGFKFEEDFKYVKKKYDTNSEGVKSDIEEKVKAKYEKKFEKKYATETDVVNDRNNKGFGSSVISLIVWLVRFVALIIMLPLWIMIIGLSIAIGLLAYLWVTGVPFFGVVLTFIGFLGLFITIAAVFGKLVFGKKQSLASVAWLLVLSSLLIGVGMPIALNDFSDLDPIYVTTQESALYDIAKDRFEEIIPYSADTIYDFGTSNLTFVLDETLKNTIVVEGYGGSFVRAHVVNRGDNTYSIYLTPDINSFSDVKALVDTTFLALKDGRKFQFDDQEIQLTVRIPKGENEEFKYYDKQGNITIIQEVLK